MKLVVALVFMISPWSEAAVVAAFMGRSDGPG
jgi:hypothetical protein